MSDKTEQWIGFRQNAEGNAVAMFAMPSGRIREVPVNRGMMLDALTDLSRAIKYDLTRQGFAG